MFPTLNHFGVGIIPWSPLARGILTRPLKSDKRTTRGDTDPCVCFVTSCSYSPSDRIVPLAPSLGIWIHRVQRKLLTG
jgi:aryl-alcohol dehydrogenase-like predicted oxidoreductase